MRIPEQVTLTRNTTVTASLVFLLMLAGALVTITSTFVSLQNQLVADTAAIASLQSDNVSSKIALATINAQLKSIDTRLVDIQDRIRKD